MKKIREMVNDGVKDDDKLYYAKDGVTPDLGFKMLLRDSDVLELVNIAMSNSTGVCKIHVFHSWSKATPPVVEDEGSNMEGDYNVDEENEGDESNGVNAENEAEKSSGVNAGNEGEENSGVNAENEVEEDIGVSKRKTKLTARKRVFRGKEKVVEVDFNKLGSDWSEENECADESEEFEVEALWERVNEPFNPSTAEKGHKVEA
ncbi:hypothetical protein AgCh_036881 [Apium graveolens]